VWPATCPTGHSNQIANEFPGNLVNGLASGRNAIRRRGLAGLVIAQRITGSIRFEEGIIGAGVHYSDSWHALLMPERPLVLS
jgi:hypothetical protein